MSIALRGNAIVEVSRKASGKTQKCDELAACFVYVGDGDELRFAGEILRDLRRMKSEALQSLAIEAGVQRIRLSEEKRETTYLDEIYVEVDGERIAPEACASPDPPAYCVADGRRYVLRQGDSLELTVDVPGCSDRTCETQLFARGYYVPTSKRARGSGSSYREIGRRVGSGEAQALVLRS